MNDRARIVRWILVSSLLVASIWTLASCSKKTSESNTATNVAPADTGIGAKPSNPAAPSGLSDANIAAIVVAANDADVSNGKQAEGKSKDADVKMFAKQMVTDHTASNDKAKALAKKLNLTPEDDDTSRQIKAQQDSIRSSIKSLAGGNFNKAYVDNEVTYHQTVLDALDKTLIPNAQNPELKQLLNDTRPVVAEHLQHAKQIQAKLGGTAEK